MVRQRFQLVKKAKDAKEAWDNAQDPQEGLVPLFNSPFYATPDTPADPQDCNRYPDSPWCGGNPLTAKFAPSIETSLVRDDCNLGIQFDGSFAFIKFPPVQIVYRSPECQTPPKPPPEPPSYPNEPVVFPPKPDCDQFLGITYIALYNSQVIRDVRNGEYFIAEYTETTSIDRVTYPYLKEIPEEDLNRLSEYDKTLVSMHRELVVEISFTCTVISSPDAQQLEAGYLPVNESISQTKIGFLIFGSNSISLGTAYFSVTFPLASDVTISFIACLLNNYEAALTANYIKPESVFYENIDSFPEVTAIRRNSLVTKLKLLCSGNPDVIPPPPPKFPMSCCPNVQQSDQLLKLILKKIGSSQLPASVPKALTDRKKGTIKIESLAEFTAYTVKQLDALCGKYPIDIEIEDADFTTEGNQTKKLKLPNIAETLAEMMGVLLVLRSESDATLNATIRALTESGSAKQMAFMAYEYAKANAEFLGYKGEQKERKIPFAFKPGEARLDKMLVEGEISVKGWENEDKEDFNDLIAPILELAAMWKVANYRKTGAGDPGDNIKKFLKNAGKLSEDLDAGILLEKVKAYNAKDDKDKDPKDLDDDWDKFTEEAETGFISQPGILDKTNPYGRPLEERPKIRDISSDTST